MPLSTLISSTRTPGVTADAATTGTRGAGVEAPAAVAGLEELAIAKTMAELFVFAAAAVIARPCALGVPFVVFLPFVVLFRGGVHATVR